MLLLLARARPCVPLARRRAQASLRRPVLTLQCLEQPVVAHRRPPIPITLPPPLPGPAPTPRLETPTPTPRRRRSQGLAKPRETSRKGRYPPRGAGTYPFGTAHAHA